MKTNQLQYFFPEVEISLTKLGKYSMISTQR